MKRLLSSLVLCAVCILHHACKDTVESIVNCSAESLLMSVHHTVDTTIPKLIHFEARYSGSHSFDSVIWEFGDGSTATGKAVDHTYAASGTYSVKAKIKINNGKSTCEGDPVRSVVVN